MTAAELAADHADRRVWRMVFPVKRHWPARPWERTRPCERAHADAEKRAAARWAVLLKLAAMP